MFSKLRVKNFRSIRDSKNVQFSKLNIFVGPNNSGKSSFLYALLLLKQTLLDKDSRSTLVTTGPHIDLGSFLDIIRGHNPNENLELEFKIDDPAIPDLRFGIGETSLKVNPYTECKVILHFNSKLNLIEVSSFEMTNKKSRIKFQGIKEKGKWTVKGIPQALQKHLEVEFEKFIPFLAPKGAVPKDEKIRNSAIEFYLTSHMRTRVLQNLFDGILYVGPIRDMISVLLAKLGYSQSQVDANMGYCQGI